MLRAVAEMHISFRAEAKCVELLRPWRNALDDLLEERLDVKTVFSFNHFRAQVEPLLHEARVAAVNMQERKI